MCRTRAKISSLFEHETLKKKKKRRKNGREPIIQTSDFSTGPLIRGARLLAPGEIHARASVSRATAARPPDRHFLPRHVASCGRARRICTSHERRTSSTVPPSPPPLSSLQSARIGGPRGDLRNVAISPGRFFRLHNLFLSYLPHLDPTAISISFRPPPLPPFRSQFLRERTTLPYFVRLVTLHHSSLFNFFPVVDFVLQLFLFLLLSRFLSFKYLKEGWYRGGG